ncbi:MAG: aspartate--tRNA(Asn) ligase [Candidatus Magasanikbacteria bacterium]|nr:aspartate--tRNA(Asn) ligase [Candidatus Magasanikbacteria bacterium]
MRTILAEISQKIGQEVEIAGFIQTRRNLGKMVFLDVRDFSGLAQVICTPFDLSAEDYEKVKTVRSEFTVLIKGVVNPRNEKNINPDSSTGKVEILAKEFKILSEAEPLPLDPADEKMGLDVYLDLLPLTLRTEKNRALFKIQAEIVNAFRNFLLSNGFTEFPCPKLVGESTEGGADVFSMEYFGYKAFLAQSPQFYKQIMVGVFERVFTVGNVYRAEKHATSRHLNEYTSLDLEFGFIKDHVDVINLEVEFIKFLKEHLFKTVAKELQMWNFQPLLIPEKFPVLKLREVQELIKKETGVDHTQEPDLEPNEEQWIGEYAKNTWQSDFVFVTHYPTKKRPVYTYPDETDPEFTKSFDLLFRGIEITTGGQRINDYKQLVANIKKWGYNPDKFEFYLQAFKYGMPPEGGLAIGLERLTAKLLGIDNVKRAALFPRDLNMIDLQLSPPEYKQKD